MKFGKGWYEMGSKIFLFEIKIKIDEEGKFFGEIFNEKSDLPVAEIIDGTIKGGVMKFTKIYPQPDDLLRIYYKLSKVTKKTYEGSWMVHYDDLVSISNKTEITFY